MNCLEYIVILLQMAAAITAMEEGLPPNVLAQFPNGIPHLPILLALTDNQVADKWAHRVISKSWRSQQLVKIQAAPNVEADPISRRQLDTYTPSAWH